MISETALPPSLEIRSVWEDEDLFEIVVRAQNGRFCGETECYTTREEMKKLSDAIGGFPKSAADEIRFSTYSSDSFSYFSLHFFCTDASGHSVVRVKIADISNYSNVRPVTNIAEFDLEVEAAAIDAFSIELSDVSRAGIRAVTAVLKGKA